MNAAKTKLLELLRGHDSKDPSAFLELANAASLDFDVATSALHELQANGQVNCAQITRNGVAETYYWPTGIIRPVPLRDYKITNTPRRSTDITIRPAEPQPEKGTAVKEPTEKDKTKPSKVSQMLELLLKNGKANGKELCEIAQSTSPNAFLKGYITRGLVKVSDKLAGKGLGKTYSLAKGVTREQLEAIQQQNPSLKREVVKHVEPTGYVTPGTATEHHRPPQLHSVQTSTKEVPQPAPVETLRPLQIGQDGFFEILLPEIQTRLPDGISLQVFKGTTWVCSADGSKYLAKHSEIDDVIASIAFLESRRAA